MNTYDNENDFMALCVGKSAEMFAAFNPIRPQDFDPYIAMMLLCDVWEKFNQKMLPA